MRHRLTQLLLFILAVVAGSSAPAAAQFCAGDCNLDNSVTIDEVLVGVNIVLGLRNRHDCPPADSDNDEMVTVDELVRAVHSALDGCPPLIPVCHDAGECPTPYVSCRAPGEFLGCGVCRTFEDECFVDDECQGRGEGLICAPARSEDCPCSPANICQPGCSTAVDCDEGQECDRTHRCVPARCPAGACPANFTCRPGTPTSVCLRQSCEQDSQCRGGFCVKQACYSELGTCSVPVPGKGPL